MELLLEPIWQSPTQQRVYRRLVEAMSRPGSVVNLGLADASGQAALAVLATLLDQSVTLCDLDELLSAQEWRFLAARLAPANEAHFVLAHGSIGPRSWFAPRLGTLPGPDQSATLVLEGAWLGAGDTRLVLSGPGIKATREVLLAGFHSEWFVRRAAWNANFPLGIDLILVDRSRILCLPRTTTVTVRKGAL
jgi:alpha-D-ribose 1-methylphosphonate 5-triphosphate synthase subunit PhnH